MIELADVRAAAAVLHGVGNRTPVLTSRTLDARMGARVFVKAECYQRAGAFKFRGAYNAMCRLPETARRRGVAAFSSGNHAQAVALSARVLGTSAVIVMPKDTPAEKLAATRDYGAEVILYDRYADDRERLGRKLADERQLTLIPPYEHPDVIAGQGTVALELVEAVDDLDLLVVPVGGGGLIAGCAIAAKALRPSMRVIGVEPETGDDTCRSLQAGRRVRIPVPRTIADGQQADIPGQLTFSVNARLLDGVVLVSDDEILDAMVFLFERLNVVAEPSGASALAALLAGRLSAAGQRIGVVLSGGNVGTGRFCELLGRGGHINRRI